MFRLFLALAVPAATFALAAASLAGKGILAEPGGEPMLVANLADEPALLPASLSADDCAARLLLTGQIPESAFATPGTHVLALALQPVADGLAVAVQEIPAGVPGAGASLYLAVDAAGRILAVSETADFGLGEVRTSASACPPAVDPALPGAV